MGLDNFWVAPANNQRVTSEKLEGLKVWGGMLSPNGNGGFRGKVYADIIQHYADTSIYEELDNQAVMGVWYAIEGIRWEDLTSDEQSILDEQAYWDDFKKMWRYYAEQGFGLHAWY